MKTSGNIHRRGIKHLPIICHSLGVDHVVICPGSRNAPLIIAFAQSKLFQLFSITDERSAGFFALGLAIETQKPVVIISTSGTAVLNLYPAVCEAYYQNQPLILLTADRPAELIDQADGQTIRQRNVFANHVKWSTELPVETKVELDLWHNDRLMAQAFDIATKAPKGPVHVNIPLREPLYDTLPNSLPQKIIKSIDNNTDITKIQTDYLIEQWNNARKKLIIVGFNYNLDCQLNQVLSNITNKYTDVIVIAENLSNLNDPNFIFAPERFIASLNENEKLQFQPDILITFGNSIVSKRLKQYLRKYQPQLHWSLNEQNVFTDTFFSLTHHWNISALKFFEIVENQCLNIIKHKINYRPYFIEKDKKLRDLHHKIVEHLPFSDIVAMHHIFQSIPQNIKLHFSNSMPIRYSQLFSPNSNVQYYCNRGTSGIDGCISTAVGMASVSNKPVVIISGDLAFIYDSNALWNNYIPSSFKIIVLNNNGGNIFRMIETSTEIDNLLDYFETPHQVNIQSLAEAFGLTYLFADNKENLKLNLEELFNNNFPTVLEIKTNKEINTFAYKTYFKQLFL